MKELKEKRLLKRIVDLEEGRSSMAVAFTEYQQKLLNDNRRLQRQNTFLLDLCSRHGISPDKVRGRLTVEEWEELRAEVQATS